MILLLALALLASQDGETVPTVPFPKPEIAGVAETDYPPASLLAGEEGTSVVAFTLGPSGNVSSCSLVKSSGFDRLDDASCRVVMHFKFHMTPESAVWVNKIRKTQIKWQTPPTRSAGVVRGVQLPVPQPDKTRGLNTAEAGEVASGRRVNIGLDLSLAENGSVQSCAVRTTSGSAILNKKACDMALKWTYQPATKDGTPVKCVMREIFLWAAPDFITQ